MRIKVGSIALFAGVLLVTLVCVKSNAELPLPRWREIPPFDSGTPVTIYVPDDYSTIQEAVDAANPGDTIIVRDGTYIENVDVSKDHLTIRSENGAEVTIVQATGSTYEDHVFKVITDNVKISGFTVKGNLRSGGDGFHLYYGNHCSLSDNILMNNDSGIFVQGLNNSIVNNIVSNNCLGIELWWDSCYNEVINNTASKNNVGIYLSSADENIIRNNLILTSMYDGIQLFCNSTNNRIIMNTVSGSQSRGIYLDVLENNQIYTNNFINRENWCPSGTQTWNSPKQVTYAYNGKTYANYLGNYWSDYGGEDGDGDGVGDVPYRIERFGNSYQDNYPLMMPFGNYEIGGEAPPEEPPLIQEMVKPVEGWLVQRFDFDEDVGYEGHEGIDIDSSIDEKEVVATADGTVVCVHRSITSGAGLWVWIWHGEIYDLNKNVEENISSRYLHLKDIPEEIQPGDKVERGKTVIGSVSNTGDGLWHWRFPPHLHFEVRQGGNPDGIMSGTITYKDTEALNPLRFIEYEDRSKKAESLIISAHCPIDLVIEDPDGLSISKDVSEIPTASYFELPLDEDGNPGYEFVAIDNRKQGRYLIQVVAEPAAQPDNTYTLEVSVNGSVTAVAENIQIRNIPDEPYILSSTQTEIIPIIPATIDFDPDTLNLKGEGKWITVYIELPIGHGYHVSDINVGRTFLEGLLEVQHSDIQNDVLMVKFDRQYLIIFLESVVGVIPPDDIPLTVTGELKDGRRFEGTDTIRVIDEGKNKE